MPLMPQLNERNQPTVLPLPLRFLAGQEAGPGASALPGACSAMRGGEHGRAGGWWEDIHRPSGP